MTSFAIRFFNDVWQIYFRKWGLKLIGEKVHVLFSYLHFCGSNPICAIWQEKIGIGSLEPRNVNLAYIFVFSLRYCWLVPPLSCLSAHWCMLLIGVVLLFQGKGKMRTYWLLGEKTEVYVIWEHCWWQEVTRIRATASYICSVSRSCIEQHIIIPFEGGPFRYISYLLKNCKNCIDVFFLTMFSCAERKWRLSRWNSYFFVLSIFRFLETDDVYLVFS